MINYLQIFLLRIEKRWFSYISEELKWLLLSVNEAPAEDLYD